MKTNEIVLGLALTALCAASARAADVTTTTDIPGVSARLAYARQYDGVLHVGVALSNSGHSEASLRQAMVYGEAYVIDPTAKQKHFPLKDTQNLFLAGPVSDANDGGRWFPKLPGDSEALVWLLFEAVPAGRAIDIHLPSVGPMEKVIPVEGAPEDGTSAACAVHPVVGKLVSAKRDEKALRVQIELSNPGTKPAATKAIVYKDVFVLDPVGKRKYGLLTDSAGQFVASPVSDHNDGGRWFAKVPANGKAVLNLTFQAPPDRVKSVSIVVPWFAPFEAVQMEGAGALTDAGSGVAGDTKNLDATLKDLGAEKTADGIKVALSADLLFDFDKSELKKEADPKLAELGKVLAAYPDAQVTIDGFTDSIGNDAYNLTLSEKRARTVATWLEKNAAVKPNRLRTKGYGKTRPVAPNTKADGSDDPDGRAKNRRVEIFVKTKSS